MQGALGSIQGIRNGGPAVAASRSGSRFLSFLRRSPRILGLDIGSAMIKAVSLEMRNGEAAVRQIGMTATPAAALVEGALADGIAAARALQALYNYYGLDETRVAAAVSGPKVVCQTDVPASGFSDAEGEFVRRKAGEALTFPIENAAWGAQSANEVVPRAVLWAAAPLEAVEWMREAISLSGRRAAAIEAESCALANVYSFNYEPSAGDQTLLLHVGARHLTLVLVRGWTVLYGRSSPVARPWRAAEETLAERLRKAFDPHWEQISKRAGERGIGRVLLSGGAARVPEAVELFEKGLGLRVEELEPFRRAAYPPSSSIGRLIQDHGPSFAVAAGLALSSVTDL